MNETDLRNFITGMKLHLQIILTDDECMDELNYLTEMTDAEARTELHLNTGLSFNMIDHCIQFGKEINSNAN